MKEFLTDKQKENLRFFQDNLEKFVSDPLMKFKHLVIHDRKVVGVYDTFEAALSFAAANLPPGEYVIQETLSEDDFAGFLYPAVA
jgi:hypothetical protein